MLGIAALLLLLAHSSAGATMEGKCCVSSCSTCLLCVNESIGCLQSACQASQGNCALCNITGEAHWCPTQPDEDVVNKLQIPLLAVCPVVGVLSFHTAVSCVRIALVALASDRSGDWPHLLAPVHLSVGSSNSLGVALINTALVAVLWGMYHLLPSPRRSRVSRIVSVATVCFGYGAVAAGTATLVAEESQEYHRLLAALVLAGGGVASVFVSYHLKHNLAKKSRYRRASTATTTTSSSSPSSRRTSAATTQDLLCEGSPPPKLDLLAGKGEWVASTRNGGDWTQRWRYLFDEYSDATPEFGAVIDLIATAALCASVGVAVVSSSTTRQGAFTLVSIFLFATTIFVCVLRPFTTAHNDVLSALHFFLTAISLIVAALDTDDYIRMAMVSVGLAVVVVRSILKGIISGVVWVEGRRQSLQHIQWQEDEEGLLRDEPDIVLRNDGPQNLYTSTPHQHPFSNMARHQSVASSFSLTPLGHPLSPDILPPRRRSRDRTVPCTAVLASVAVLAVSNVVKTKIDLLCFTSILDGDEGTVDDDDDPHTFRGIKRVHSDLITPVGSPPAPPGVSPLLAPRKESLMKVHHGPLTLH